VSDNPYPEEFKSSFGSWTIVAKDSNNDFYNMKASIENKIREIYEKHCGLKAVVKYNDNFVAVIAYVPK